jgi:hypothetical protein
MGGAAAFLATGAAFASSTTEISGTVEFAHGGLVPKGLLEIYLEDTAARENQPRGAATTRVRSDGKSRSITFSLSLPASLSDALTLQVVARLERADGWLIARGSAKTDADSPVNVTLNRAMY